MKKILISVTSLLLALMLMVPVFAESTTDTASALTEAQEAYKAAKQTQKTADYEAELQAMVEAGTLTQEQADLLLAASKEQTALKNGVCPSCGYEFQTKISVSKNGKSSKKNSATSSDDSTALEQAQSAYAAAKEASELTEYENELKAMVEAGTLTQEQADLLLNAAKEAECLAEGICPNCGYQFQTVTVTSRNGKYSEKSANYSYKAGKNGKH